MKLDQIAYYSYNPYHTNQIKETLGLAENEWVKDQVTAKIRYKDKEGKFLEYDNSQALLLFNYTFGIEIEILTYNWGPFWHQFVTDGYNKRVPFLSHQGFHMEDNEEFPGHLEPLLVQEAWTQSHTNPYLLEKKRKYHYKIYDTQHICGTFSKFIRRIEE